MPTGFLEIVYETGRNSIVSYDSLDDAIGGIKAHHERAKAGGRALASFENSPPAERVVRVLRYDKHPNDYNAEQTMSAEVLEKQVKELIKKMSDDNGVVAVDRFAAEVRGLTHPMVTSPGAHDSIFLMDEVEELDYALWDGEE